LIDSEFNKKIEKIKYFLSLQLKELSIPGVWFTFHSIYLLSL
jgi:hypothetical protein